MLYLELSPTSLTHCKIPLQWSLYLSWWAWKIKPALPSLISSTEWFFSLTPCGKCTFFTTLHLLYTTNHGVHGSPGYTSGYLGSSLGSVSVWPQDVTSLWILVSCSINEGVNKMLLIILVFSQYCSLNILPCMWVIINKHKDMASHSELYWWNKKKSAPSVIEL